MVAFCTVFVLSGCKKDSSDPNLAFASLGYLKAYDGASPEVPYVMVTGGYSLSVKNKFLGLQNCENPISPGPFITDSVIQCNLLSIFRDQDQKTVLTPGNPIWIDDTSTVSYWVDVSVAGKLKKLASFKQLNMPLLGLKDGYLWAIDRNTGRVSCYNLNLAIGKHVTDISTLLVSSIQLEGIASGYTIEKDNALYVASSMGKVFCLDISTRSNPVVKSVIKEQLCSGLELYEDVLLVKANNNILLIDVSEALNPQLRSRIKVRFEDAKIHNGYLYAGFQEMNVYDISDLSKPSLLRKLNVAPNEISDYQFWGEYIFCKSRTYPYFTPAQYVYILKGNRY